MNLRKRVAEKLEDLSDAVFDWIDAFLASLVDYAHIVILTLITAAWLWLGVLWYFKNDSEKTIDVHEACEVTNVFVHEGKKYYCAPWIEQPEQRDSIWEPPV